MNSTTGFYFCKQLKIFYDFYLQLFIGLTGSALNLICIITFLRVILSLNKKEDIYKYLLFESINDTYFTLRISLRYIFDCQNECLVDQVYILKLFNLIFLIYAGYVAQLFSVFCQIASSLNVYLTIIGKSKIFERISYKMAIFLMSLFSFGINSYKLIVLRVLSGIKENSNETIYWIQGDILEDLGDVLDDLHAILRDCICVIIILIMNILIAIEIKKSISKKRNMMRANSISHANKERIRRAEIRLTAMIFTISTITLVSHGLNFFGYMYDEIYNNDCFNSFLMIIYLGSYSIKFFLYYFFNLIFQQVFNNFILAIFKFTLKK